jgi:hypothetical protein
VLLYRFVPPPITFTMMGDILSGRSIEKDWMPLDRIDRDMARAAIAAEDSKFCSHRGFDQDAIAAAMRRNAEGRGVIRGGSTISQQTAKNAFLWQGGGYFRKGLEAWFTLLIENLWSKQRIMEVYLNIARPASRPMARMPAPSAISARTPRTSAARKPPASPPSCRSPRNAKPRRPPASRAATATRSHAGSASSPATVSMRA